MITAFDSDVLIYAAIPAHPLGEKVWAHLSDSETTAVGSLLLLPEVLSKPQRAGRLTEEVVTLISLLGRVDMRPVDGPTARLSLQLATDHQLKAVDAAHLATAIISGADQFLTNNRKDFPRTIGEIDVVYPEDLA